MNDRFEIIQGNEISGRTGIQNEYIGFINKVFRFDEKNEDFALLLPKLFGKGRDTYRTTTFAVAKNTGNLAGCAGRFPVDLEVCGTVVKAFGIGNVGVRQDLRNSGIMSAVMTSAVKKMIDDGADMSFLGGSRQRYNHFGFERCGAGNLFSVSSKNILSTAINTKGYETAVIQRGNKEYLDYIFENDRRPFKAVRNIAELYDILVSWHAEPFIFLKNGLPKGWAVIQGGDLVTELYSENKDEILVFAGLLTENRDHLNFMVPEFDRDLFEALWPIADSVHHHGDNCFNVFNYRKVIGAFLKLRSTFKKLQDGRFVILIKGIAGEENLCIEIKNGTPSVNETKENPDIVLEHMEAMNFFFAEFAPVRNGLAPEISGWFPLPIYIYPADDV